MKQPSPGMAQLIFIKIMCGQGKILTLLFNLDINNSSALMCGQALFAMFW
jgi:hypothetical protein